MRIRIYHIIGVGLLTGVPPVCAQERATHPAPVIVESIQSAVQGDETRVTVLIHGKTEPRLTVAEKNVTIRLPGGRSGSHLASRMTSGGLVKRIGFQTGSRAGEAVTEEAQISLELGGPADASFAAGTDPQTVIVRLAPRGAANSGPITRSEQTRLFDIAAYQTDASMLLKSLAQEANCNILLSDKVTSKVTINLHQVELAKAVDLITRSAGLTVKRDGDTYLVSGPEEARPSTPVVFPGAPLPNGQGPATPGDSGAKKIDPLTGIYEVYHCHYILASDLSVTLSKMFAPEELRVNLGAATFAPRLEPGNSTASVTGIESATKTQDKADAGANAHDIVLYGSPEMVARALALVRRLDARRPQLRIGVTITDVSNDALRELGVQWAWSSFSVNETPGTGSGINFGSFAHDPVSLSATLSALEKDNRAKLLAAPTLSLLDGERSFMLIGDRLIYPKLIGYTQAQTPIFDKEEARVGIYLQVAAQTVSDNEILITLYPQVSVVTGYLNVNGASYPQISTREQQTTIRVKDGEKIVVGGLIRDEEIKNIQRVPLLSKIPLFGELFTYRNTTHHKSEVIVIITPQILKD
jgi:type II secretory pathway component GspD/PulD (secretin)